jgi:signal transduction histidine kinase
MLRTDEVDDLNALIERLIQMEVDLHQAQLGRDNVRRQLDSVLAQIQAGEKA